MFQAFSVSLLLRSIFPLNSSAHSLNLAALRNPEFTIGGSNVQSARWRYSLIQENMKKYILLLLTFITLAGRLSSQYNITGTVFDAATGEKIFGASVYLPDLRTGATTDTNGTFIIRHVPQGEFLADVRMLGYASQALTVKSVSENSVVDTSLNKIQLIKTPAEYHPVIVTGVSGSTGRIYNPVPTALNTRDHILQHGGTNATAAIAELPGISVISTGNAIAKPIIRGLGYNRVVVLRNNIRQEGQQWGDEHGIEIDEFEIDRAEVIKGPGSIMYGSDAMAGVVNFLTAQPVADGKVKTELASSFHTNGMLFGNSLMNTGSRSGVNWMFRVSRKTAGNYRTPSDGYVANTGFNEFNFSGNIGLNRKWGVSQIGFSSFNQNVALPEGERDSTGKFLVLSALNDSTVAENAYNSDALKGYNYHMGIPRQRVQHHRIVSSNNLYFGNSRIKLDVGVQQNIRQEFADVLNPDAAELSMKLSTANVNAIYFLPEKNNLQVTTGVQLQLQKNENSGEEYIIPDYVQNDAGAFVHVRKNTRLWYFSAGIRGDIRSLNTNNLFIDSTGEFSNDSVAGSVAQFHRISKTFNAISGAAGVSRKIGNRSVIRLNIARGFRAPNIPELSSNGRHEGTFRYEIGNSQLKPETSLQGDLGITINTDHFNFEFSGFANSVNNFIYLSKLSSVNGGDSIVDPTYPAPAFSFIQGSALLYGGEIYTDLHPHPLDWLHFENSVSIVFTELRNNPDSMHHLPFTPPVKYQSEINAHAERKWKCFSDSYLGISAVHYFAQNRIYSAFETETSTPGYTLVEINAGTHISTKKDVTICKLYLSVSNLFDVSYQSHLSRLKYAPVNPVNGNTGIYGMGRNISFRLIIPIESK